MNWSADEAWLLALLWLLLLYLSKAPKGFGNLLGYYLKYFLRNESLPRFYLYPFFISSLCIPQLLAGGEARGRWALPLPTALYGQTFSERCWCSQRPLRGATWPRLPVWAVCPFEEAEVIPSWGQYEKKIAKCSQMENSNSSWQVLGFKFEKIILFDFLCICL